MKPDHVLIPVMERLGIDSLRIHQHKPIKSLMNGNDTLVIAGTASGKSLIYQLPALLHENQLTLVVEPTLSLIYNQVKFLQDHGINADYIDHFRTKKDVKAILHSARKNKLTFLYVTPERLQSHRFLETMQDIVINIIVVDECHCATEWGYTFRDTYLQIGKFIDALPKRPVVCACSATIPENRLDEIVRLLHLENPNVYRSDLSRKNLVLLKKDVTSGKKSLEKRLEERFELLDKYINKYHCDGSVVIYALTVGYVDAIYNYLNEQYPDQVACYHAQMKPESRRHKMELEFLQGKRKIMVATSAFAMGIDVPDIELVLHFNTPVSLVDYIQQIGRGGRNQQIRAHCVLFYDDNGDDAKIVKSFAKRASKGAADRITENYAEMWSFIDSKNCMVQDILAYQGQMEDKSCKCCTNCARKRRHL